MKKKELEAYREGLFEGAISERQLIVEWLRKKEAAAADKTDEPDFSIYVYAGDWADDVETGDHLRG